jgi:hypothetical protein
MAGTAAGSWVALWALTGARWHPELLFGMLGPLVGVCASWVAIARAARGTPERLTAVMMIGFAAKMVLFGAYVAVMLRGVELRPVPFVAAFTGYFIALYAMEALFLRRLLMNFAEGVGTPLRK